MSMMIMPRKKADEQDNKKRLHQWIVGGCRKLDDLVWNERRTRLGRTGAFVLSTSSYRAHGYTSAGPGDSVKKGRQPFGRITIANCDSGAGSDLKLAITMASRAVNELG